MDNNKFTNLMAQIVVGCIALGIVALTVWFILWLFL